MEQVPAYVRYRRRTLVLALAAVVASSVLVSINSLPASAAVTNIGRLRPLSNLTLCLDVPNPTGSWPSTSYPPDGTAISVYSCHGNPNQRWQVEDLGADRYRIKSAWSGQCLSMASESNTNGTLLTVTACGTPSSFVRRKIFSLIGRTSTDFHIFTQVYPNGPSEAAVGQRNCLDVAGGAGSSVASWRCPSASTHLAQNNQTWRLDVVPASEQTNWRDGTISSFESFPPEIGRITNASGAICSGSSVVSPQGTAAIMTAAHCALNYPTDIWYGQRFDIRRPYATGWFHADSWVYVPGEDVVFARPGGKYNTDWTWNGASLAASGPEYGLNFTGIPNGSYAYTWGYPANLGSQNAPIGCFNPTQTLGASSVVVCTAAGGLSGSPWIVNGTSQARGVSNTANIFDFPSVVGGTATTNRIATNWFTSTTYMYWSAL
jgi:hypothetical protein